MSDPVEDGVTLLRRWLGLCHTGWSNDELRVIVRNIIAPAVADAADESGERAHGHYMDGVQAERERIRALPLPDVMMGGEEAWHNLHAYAMAVGHLGTEGSDGT